MKWDWDWFEEIWSELIWVDIEWALSSFEVLWVLFKFNKDNEIKKIDNTIWEKQTQTTWLWLRCEKIKTMEFQSVVKPGQDWKEEK